MQWRPLTWSSNDYVDVANRQICLFCINTNVVTALQQQKVQQTCTCNKLI